MGNSSPKPPWRRSGRGGNSSSSPSREPSAAATRVGVDDFSVISRIGEGHYASVLLVKRNRTDPPEFYAMKVLNKDLLIERSEVEHTLTERLVLEQASHPFLIRMRWAFQTPDKLHIVMTFANGGELFSHLKRERRFSEERVRFYSSEICLGLGYLHSKDIVYRDLKPENILLDCDGHIVLTDFGLSKMLRGDTTRTFCGTPEYLAPEVILNRGHGKPVDWWSFGTLLYEMLVGVPPFYSRDVHEMYELILHATLQAPEFLQPTTRDLLHKLLVREPKRRLGTGGVAEVKRHGFFRTVDWQAVYDKRDPPPFKPRVDVKPLPGRENIDREFLRRSVPNLTVEPDRVPQIPAEEQTPFEGFTYSSEQHLACSSGGDGPLR